MAENRMVIIPEYRLENTRHLTVSKAGHFLYVPHHLAQRPGIPEFIMLYCTAGEGWVQDYRRIGLSAGDLALIPQGLAHAYGSSRERPWQLYWLHFRCMPQDFALAQTLHSMQYVEVFHPSLREDILQPFQRILQLLDTHLDFPDESLCEAAGQLLLLLGRVLRGDAPAGNSPLQDEHVRRAMQYLRDHLYGQTSLDELSAYLGISKYHLSHCFQAAAGQAPIVYYNRLKCQEACHLLLSTEKSVSEIAAALHFSTPYYFSERFKRFTGYSPRQYRRLFAGLLV